MISARKVNAMVYPDGRPTNDGDSMHVYIEAGQGIAIHKDEIYKFDSCNWKQ